MNKKAKNKKAKNKLAKDLKAKKKIDQVFVMLIVDWPKAGQDLKIVVLI